MIWEVDQPERTLDGLDAAGRPDPAYAAALGLRPAPYGRRALAFVCDLAIWTLLQLPLWLGAVPLLAKLLTGSISPYGFVNHPDFVLAVVMASVSVALMLVYAILQWVLHGTRGMTIGKSLTGIRSVNVRTLEKPRVGAVLLRLLIVAAAGIVPVVGTVVILASPTFDPQERGRGLHDRATRIWLVDIRRGLNPYDEKRMRVARKTVKAEPVPERADRPSLATPTVPGAHPDYRPGTRISAGVLGAMRSTDAATPPATSPSLAGASPLSGADAGIVAAPPGREAPGAAGGQASTPPTAAPPAPVRRRPLQTPAPAEALVLGLRFDTGDTVPVARAVVLGRDPDDAASPGAHPARLADPTRSLSKTHAVVRPVEGGLEVVDRHSTNGSGIIRRGVEELLSAGAPVIAREGDTVRFGDRHAEVVRL